MSSLLLSFFYTNSNTLWLYVKIGTHSSNRQSLSSLNIMIPHLLILPTSQHLQLLPRALLSLNHSHRSLQIMRKWTVEISRITPKLNTKWIIIYIKCQDQQRKLIKERSWVWCNKPARKEQQQPRSSSSGRSRNQQEMRRAAAAAKPHRTKRWLKRPRPLLSDEAGQSCKLSDSLRCRKKLTSPQFQPLHIAREIHK